MKMFKTNTVVHHPSLDMGERWFKPGDVLPEDLEAEMEMGDLVLDDNLFVKDDEDLPSTVRDIDYTSLNVDQLDQLLGDRGLSTDGKKTEKILRLQQDDAAHR